MSRSVLRILRATPVSSETLRKYLRYSVAFMSTSTRPNSELFQTGQIQTSTNQTQTNLVKLFRAIDAITILANRSSLESPIFIKPDLSPTERATESILLRERWLLFQNGHSRKSIKLNSQHGCVNNQLYGKVINSQFQCSTQSILQALAFLFHNQWSHNL